ncbi:transcriptional regulator [Isoptericola halotolerans]|uniref:transcriptional regulator n=1 Tax=Isoptericola halotolerans TaxID=300560 RepID=UPI0038906012
MSRPPTALPVLHGVRLLGFADALAVAGRAGLDLDGTTRELHDAARRGWVQHTSFADLEGWSLTRTGKAENERLLARQRVEADPDGVIAAGHRAFLPLNARLLRACTDWQLRPTGSGRLVPNDHTDPGWDARVLGELAALATDLARLVEGLAGVLARFGGYDVRFATALRRAQAGRSEWVDGSGIDSCHRVWSQLHEDLLATLGIDRRDET